MVLFSHNHQGPTHMKIGVFGGTFDPPHVGHLLPVEAARELLQLDEVRIIPAAVSPHKLDRESSPAETRLAMVRLAFGGNDAFVIDERELLRKPPSFMVDTLGELHREHPRDVLFLILGMDNLSEFETWKEPERILTLATVVALARPKAKPVPTNSLIAGRVRQLETPLVEVSSSSVRERVRTGGSIRYQVSDAVREYIERNRLYID